MAVVPHVLTSKGNPTDDEASLSSILTAGDPEDLIDVELKMGNDAGFVVGENFQVKFGNLETFSGGVDEINPRHFRIRNGQTAKAKINGGKILFNVENIGWDHDFHMEGTEQLNYKVRCGHYLRMRNLALKDNKLACDTMVGKTGSPKTYVKPSDSGESQQEREGWGFKIGCYKAENGPSGDIEVTSNDIDLHAGDYSGSGTELAQVKAIQLMVCPATSHAKILNNKIRHSAHRGIHIVDYRGFLEVRGNDVDMNAPYVHKGTSTGTDSYHGFGIASCTGLSVVNGYRYQWRPIDNGRYIFEKNDIKCHKEDAVGVQAVGYLKSRIGPILFADNTVTMAAEAGSSVAALIWNGMDKAEFVENTFKGNAQVGMLIGAMSAAWGEGTIASRFKADVSAFEADHGIMAYIGADALRCALYGKGLAKENVLFPVDGNGSPLLNKCNPYGYDLSTEVIPTGLQSLLTQFQADLIGWN